MPIKCKQKKTGTCVYASASIDFSNFVTNKFKPKE